MKYNNYKIIKEKLINEIDSKAILLEHEKTGARVLKVENSDNNKVFVFLLELFQTILQVLHILWNTLY